MNHSPTAHTCLIPARQLRAGLKIAAPVSTPTEGRPDRVLRLPFEITAVRRHRDHVIVSGMFLAPAQEQHPGHHHTRLVSEERVTVLTSHYGICADCGSLSPCPDEWHERHANAEVEELFASLTDLPISA